MKWNMGWMHDTLDTSTRIRSIASTITTELTFSHAVRVLRELRAAAVARRGRLRQGLAARQDARRRLAAVRQPAAAVRLHVGAPGQEAAVHGRRVRPAPRVEARQRARLARCRSTRSTPACSAGSATSTRSTAPSPRCTSSISSRPGFEWVDCHDAEASVADVFCAARATGAPLLVVCNFTPVLRTNYASAFRTAARGASCSTATRRLYGGSGVGNFGGVEAAPVPAHGRAAFAQPDAAAARARCCSSPSGRRREGTAAIEDRASASSRADGRARARDRRR